MDTTETTNASPQGDRREEEPHLSQSVTSAREPSEQSKTKKKKKKSGKAKPSSTEAPQKPAEEGGAAGEELVSVVFPFKVIPVDLSWAVRFIDFVSECVLESRRAAEQGAGLVHRAAGTGTEVPEGDAKAESVGFIVLWCGGLSKQGYIYRAKF